MKPAKQVTKGESKLARRQRAPRLSSEARRAQLLDCAFKVFAREGIGHANHTQIASEAGVSLPAVFAYFPTHESLTQAVLDHVSDFMMARLILPAQTGQKSAAAEIEKTLVDFLDLIDSHYEMARIWLDWSTAVRATTWPLYQEHHKKVCAVFEATIARAQAAGETDPSINRSDAAWVIISLGHMIAQMKFAGEPSDRIVRAVHSVIVVYFPTMGTP